MHHFSILIEGKAAAERAPFGMERGAARKARPLQHVGQRSEAADCFNKLFRCNGTGKEFLQLIQADCFDFRIQTGIKPDGHGLGFGRHLEGLIKQSVGGFIRCGFAADTLTHCELAIRKTLSDKLATFGGKCGISGLGGNAESGLPPPVRL